MRKQVWLIFFVVAALGSTSCSKLMGFGEHTPDPIPAFPDGKAGLEAFGRAVLDAARKDDRNRVHDLMATLILSPAELAMVVGAERASRHGGRYVGMMETIVNRGALELVGQVYEHKYDDVEVFPDEDPKTRAAILNGAVPYSLRYKKKNEDKGLRYDFFIYLGGKWKTGNKLAKDF